MTVMVDTNVLVYDAIENSPHHESAVIVVFKEMDDVIFVITTYKSSKISRYIP